MAEGNRRPAEGGRRTMEGRIEVRETAVTLTFFPRPHPKNTPFPSSYSSVKFKQNQKPFADITKGLEPFANKSRSPWFANSKQKRQYLKTTGLSYVLFLKLILCFLIRDVWESFLLLTFFCWSVGRRPRAVPGSLYT